ncbi:ACT domain-containing protein [Clostridioides difficile]|uniref:ACT domain-containing protein n=1 Tax=Clostridioides difficile TaxID=1496 RepID=UPI001034C82E|nr:ACT domain-containing protein [Clostridioides difficile]
MENTVYAKLNQGIDSVLRVAMTLRRREVDIQSISMTVDNMNNSGIKLIVNEEKTSLDSVLNHMKKLHDIREITVERMRH